MTGTNRFQDRPSLSVVLWALLGHVIVVGALLSPLVALAVVVWRLVWGHE